MSNEPDLVITTQRGLNNPDTVKVPVERRGVCWICGTPGKKTRTFEVIVTPFAMHSNTVATKAEGRNRYVTASNFGRGGALPDVTRPVVALFSAETGTIVGYTDYLVR